MTTYNIEPRTKDDLTVRDNDIGFRKTTIHVKDDKTLVIIQNDDMIHLSPVQVSQLKASLNWEYL